jgi:hypothetical protein
MAKRSTPQPAPPQVPLALTRPRTEVVKQLQERIDLGKELQARPIRTHQDMEAYQGDAGKWDDYDKELLKRLFTNDSIYKEYGRIFISVLADNLGFPG